MKDKFKIKRLKNIQRITYKGADPSCHSHCDQQAQDYAQSSPNNSKNTFSHG